MGYITLTMQQGFKTKDYIIFSAEFLNDAWISEAHDDGTTSIIKQFRCKKFRKCFDQLAQYVDSLGKLVNMEGHDIREKDLESLKDIITNKRYLPKKKVKVFNIGLRNPLTYKLWDWNHPLPDDLA